MRVHPFIAAAALLLAGVTAFATTAVLQHRRARARRPPPPELEEAPLAPRHIFSKAPAPALRSAAPPAPAPVRAELHVHITGPHGAAVGEADVFVHRRGDDPDDWTLIISAEEAEIPDGKDEPVPRMTSAFDLEPGRYDVRVEAEGMRTAHVSDVPTGPNVVEVALTRAPMLLGAIGELGAAGCAGTTIVWSGPGDEAETGEATLDDEDCTFYAPAIPEEGPVMVVARRGTLEARALVTPPLAGDPAVLCLAPPCAQQPASLLVYLADSDRREVADAILTWTLQGDDLRGAMGASEGAGLVYVHGRRAGDTLALRAQRGAHVAETTTRLGAGVTEVLLTLPAEPPEADSEGIGSDRVLDVGDGDEDDEDDDEDDDVGGVVRDRVMVR
jgi:hypothetical protein